MSSPWSQSSEERAPQCLGLACSLTDKSINPFYQSILLQSVIRAINVQFGTGFALSHLGWGRKGNLKPTQCLIRKSLFREYLQCPTFRLRLPLLVLSFMQLTNPNLCLPWVHFQSPLSKKSMSCPQFCMETCHFAAEVLTRGGKFVQSPLWYKIVNVLLGRQIKSLSEDRRGEEGEVEITPKLTDLLQVSILRLPFCQC